MRQIVRTYEPFVWQGSHMNRLCSQFYGTWRKPVKWADSKKREETTEWNNAWIKIISQLWKKKSNFFHSWPATNSHFVNGWHSSAETSQFNCKTLSSRHGLLSTLIILQSNKSIECLLMNTFFIRYVWFLCKINKILN